MWTIFACSIYNPFLSPYQDTLHTLPDLCSVVTVCQAQGQVLVLDIVLSVLRSVAVVSATQDTAVLQLVRITQDSVTKQN